MRFHAALIAVMALAGPRLVAAFPGTLDPFFGSDGRVTTDFGGDATAHAVVLEPDGKIVAVGGATASDVSRFALARYDTDGMLDVFFGASGLVTTPFADDAEAFAAVVQPDGRVVAVGRASADFALARYDTNGRLDPFFGPDGRVTTPFPGDAVALAVALQPDGRLVAVGRASGDFALARYDTNGSLDHFFGSGGRVTTAFAGDAAASAVVLEPDGRLIAAGRVAHGARTDFALARYDTDGTLDHFFGSSSGGRVVTTFSDDAEASALVLQPDGKIVAAGRVSNGASRSFALARYDPDGTLDPFFGVDGRVTTAFHGGAEASALVLQPDGKLVAIGRVSTGGTDAFALARYDTDGTLDPFFGSGGRMVTTFSGDAVAFAAALESDGGLIAAGGVSSGGRSDFALARYETFTLCGNGTRELGEQSDEGAQNGAPGSCTTAVCTLKVSARCLAQGPHLLGATGAPLPGSVAGPLGQPECRGERLLPLLEQRLERARMLLESSATTTHDALARKLATRAARLLRRTRRASVRARRRGRLSPTCAASVIETLRSAEQRARRP